MADNTGLADVIEVTGSMSISAWLSAMCSAINAAVLNGVRTVAVRSGSVLAGFLASKGQDILNWFYVEAPVVMQNGQNGLFKAFVRLTENQEVDMIFLQEMEDAAPVLSHTSPYLDPIVPGRIPIDPSKIPGIDR